MGREGRLNPNTREFVEQHFGPRDTLDARGRVLQEGDEIILALPGPVFFRIAQITPVLDPGAPPDLLHVHVGVMLTFTAKRGAINREFIRVRTEAEAGPSNFRMLDAQPAPEQS